MAVTVETTGTGTFTGSTTVTVTMAASPIENDVIVLVAYNTSAAAGVTTAPTDWVNAIGTDATLDPGDATFFAAAFYHIVTSAEDTANTTVWTLTNFWDSSETGACVAVALRGVDTAAIIDGLGTIGNATVSTTHVLPAIASGDISATGNFVLRFVAADGLATYTTPAAHTQRVTLNSTCGAWMGSRDATTTSGVAVAATNITCSASDESVGISWSITAASTGPIDLVVADLIAASSIDAVTLTQTHILAVADLTVAVALDSVALTQVHQLQVADLTVASTVDAVTLTQTHVLAVADLTVGSSVDIVTLTQVHQLQVADLTVSSSIDAVTLTIGDITLTVADLTVATSIDTVTLTQTHQLQVADLTVASTVDAVTLTQTHQLAVADLTVGSSIDAVTLTVGGITLTVADLTVAPSIDSVTLTQIHQLQVADLTVGSSIDAVTLSVPATGTPSISRRWRVRANDRTLALIHDRIVHVSADTRRTIGVTP